MHSNSFAEIVSENILTEIHIWQVFLNFHMRVGMFQASSKLCLNSLSQNGLDKLFLLAHPKKFPKSRTTKVDIEL